MPIPENAKLIKERVEWIRKIYPNASDKELYWRYIAFYHIHEINGKLMEKLCSDSIPSMDTVLRRLREIKEEEKKKELQKKLLVIN
ncbi:MAG: hypothetical protein QXO70_05125 [Candidatus Pacearchaeota archaeon]